MDLVQPLAYGSSTFNAQMTNSRWRSTGIQTEIISDEIIFLYNYKLRRL